MTTPVVLVTQDSRRRTCVDWFEDEDSYYAGWRLAHLVAGDTLLASPRYIRPETAQQIADVFVALVETPDRDVSFVATHTVAEPGAPLEPVPGRLGAA